MLSVVVPVYNVEHWVGAALDSILDQSLRDLEVVVIDDGSTDGSSEVVREYARRDGRVRVVRKQNAGLGAARNTGLEHVRGKYVAFADSDDLVHPGSYAAMVDLLEHSGSDFVTAAFERGEEGAAVRPRWIRRLTHVTRTGLTIEQEPWALLDITSWNKVFRRSFVERHGLRFDEGVRYEDQVPITRAYLSATFDILDKTVYLWRTRHDGTSITQQKATLADLSDRLRSQEGCAQLVRDASPEIRDTWFVKLLDYDLPSYVEAALSGHAEYADAVRSRLAALRSQVPERLWARVRFNNRVVSWALSQGDLDAALALKAWFQRHWWGLPVGIQDGHPVFELPPDLAPGVVPDRLRRVEQIDAWPHVHLLSATWEDTELVLRGSAYLLHVTDEHAPHELGLTLHLPAATGDEFAFQVPVTRYADATLDQVARRAYEDRSGSGFEARIDAEKLAAMVPPGQQELALTFHHTQGGFSHDSEITGVIAMGPGGYRDGRIVGGRLVRLSGSVEIGHRLWVHDRWAVTAGHRETEDGHVELTIAGGTSDPVVGATRGRVVARDEDAGTVTVLLEPGQSDFVDAHLRSGFTPQLHWLEEENILGGGRGGERGGYLRRGPGQRARIGPRRPAVLVTDVEADPADPGVLSVHGRSMGAAGLRLRLMSHRSAGLPSEELPAGDFTVRVPVVHDPWSLGRTALPAGRYELSLLGPDGIVSDGLVQVVTSRRLAPPTDLILGDQPLRLGVTGSWNLLVVSSALPAETASPREQLRLRRRYAAARHEPRVPVALLETFKGKMAGDSPAAIARELSARDGAPEPVFSIEDRSVPVPPGVRAVVRFSEEWFELLARAAYLVNNDNFPWFFGKAQDQVYLQTWHGTPLKRIAKDIEDPQLIPVAYMRTMEAEAASWDYLLSPSPYCSEILPRAFGYDGPLLEVGYPRNDALLVADRERVRQEVRARLGIAVDARVVLYAPTWRDVDAKVLHLDPQRLVEEIPDVTLLVRGHVNTSDRDAVGPSTRGRLRDVTLYPDVNDLFLASDVLVTDYSSVMFDFALLDRPQLFLVPDLDQYRGEVRGFYLDLAEVAPGPLFTAQDALIAHLSAGPSADEPYREARARFRARFAPWDDGQATARVVDRVFGPAPVRSGPA